MCTFVSEIQVDFPKPAQDNNPMANDSTRVKISDIATLAGVSAGTVDRVIHNRGEVSEKTRKKVMGIIREMDYQPDILASTLASRKSYQFASLLPRADKANPFWSSPAKGLQSAWDEISHFGITLQKHHFCYHSQESFIKSTQAILQDPPSGIILAPVFSGQTTIFMEQLEKLKIPVVFINTNLESSHNVAFVGQDAGSSGRVAAKLLDYGLTDQADIFIVNLISEKGGNNHILNREMGFRGYFNEKGDQDLSRITTLNIHSRNTNEVEDVLLTHLTRSRTSTEQTGIFVSNSKVFMVAGLVKQEGLQNTKLIGYDLLEQNQAFLRDGVIDFLISQQPHQQGYASVMTLFNHLVMKKPVTKNQFLPIDIITKENIDFYIKR